MAEQTQIDNREFLDPVFLKHGLEVYTYEYVDGLRNDKEERKKMIVPNAGSQEKALVCESDLIILTGLRGSGKSAYLCMTNYDRIEHPRFSGMILRKEINDAKNSGGIADTSKRFYHEFGTFSGSASYMTWNFHAGGSMKFEYYSDSYKSYVDRLRGRESSKIGIDELTQMEFKYLRFLFTLNRNSDGIPNQIIGTCNPDGNSWVYRFVGGKYITKKGEQPRSKWLDDEGFPIVEKDGVEMYFYVYGDRPDQTYWGETREEVVVQARDEMLKLCSPTDRQLVLDGKKQLEDMYVLSCTFFTGYTSENKTIGTDDYYKRLGMLSPEERARDLGGQWLRRISSTALIDMDDMDKFYANSYQRTPHRYVTADISFEGKDATVIYLWEGFHIVAVEVCRVGAESLKAHIEQLLSKWEVSENNFCFDATGIGSGIVERFSDSIAFDARSKSFDYREVQSGKLKQNISIYENVRAQCTDNVSARFKNSGYSVAHNLLYNKYDNKALIDHFNEEYVAIARDYSKENKFQAISKKEIISLIGHSSDYMDNFLLREYIDLHITYNKTKPKRKGLWLL